MPSSARGCVDDELRMVTHVSLVHVILRDLATPISKYYYEHKNRRQWFRQQTASRRLA